MRQITSDDDPGSVGMVFGHMPQRLIKARMRVEVAHLFARDGQVDIGNVNDFHVFALVT
jgi:hypothetical protein